MPHNKKEIILNRIKYASIAAASKDSGFSLSKLYTLFGARYNNPKELQIRKNGEWVIIRAGDGTKETAIKQMQRLQERRDRTTFNH